MKVPIQISWLSENGLLDNVLTMKRLELVSKDEEGIVIKDDPVSVHIVLTDGSTRDPDDKITSTSLKWTDTFLFCTCELKELGFNCD